MDRHSEDELTNQYSVNESGWENPANWWGSLYHSREDDRLWVPKPVWLARLHDQCWTTVGPHWGRRYSGADHCGHHQSRAPILKSRSDNVCFQNVIANCELAPRSIAVTSAARYVVASTIRRPGG